jgi:hypothetical protein
MIQGVIARMATFSASAKNFAVTVSVGISAVAFDRDIPEILWAGVAAVAAFLLMDFYYHLLEVRFRELYKCEVAQPLDRHPDMLLAPPKATLGNVAKVLGSRTLLPFYVFVLFLLGIGLWEGSYVPKAHAAPIRDLAGASAPDETSTKRVERPIRSEVATDHKRSGNVR